MVSLRVDNERLQQLVHAKGTIPSSPTPSGDNFSSDCERQTPSRESPGDDVSCPTPNSHGRIYFEAIKMLSDSEYFDPNC